MTIAWKHGDPQLGKGDRIEMIEMGVDPVSGNPDPDPIQAGTKGTVIRSDYISVWKQWQVHVDWDNGRGLSIVIPPDRVKKIEAQV